MTFFLSLVSTNILSRWEPKSLSLANGYAATRSFDLTSACQALSQSARCAWIPAAMDREVKTRLSSVVSAIKALAFKILERPSKNHESISGKRTRSLVPQTIESLATMEAVAADPITSAEASNVRLRSCSIFLSQESRMAPCPSCARRPED